MFKKRFEATEQPPDGGARWVGLTFSLAVCRVRNVKSKELIKLLEANGWVLRGVKESHHIYTHPAKGGHICVPHPKNDLGVGLVHKLLKQAGIM